MLLVAAPDSAFEQHAPCMTEREAAKYFGVSDEALRVWRRRGSGPKFYRIGGKLVRYALADLVAWRETQYDSCAGQVAGGRA
jgi:predicted DNA-binding transcriptional regulator AlpA